MSLKTGALVTTTAEEMDLLRQQAAAMRDLADNTKAELQELRETRFAEFLPMLRWQSPSASLQDQNNAWRYGVQVLLTNEGPGPARVRAATVSADTREDFAFTELGVPSTLPPGERITLDIYRRTEVLERRPRLMTITIRYGDLLGEFGYETTAKIRASFEEPGMSASFVDSDERSALDRRLPRIRT